MVGSAGATIRHHAVDVAGNVETTNTLVVPAAGDDLLRSAVVAVLDSDKVASGDAIGVTVRVNGAGGTPSGVVRVLSGGQVLAAGQLSDGRSPIMLDSALLGGPGKYSLVVRYDGDAAYGPARTGSR